MKALFLLLFFSISSLGCCGGKNSVATGSPIASHSAAYSPTLIGSGGGGTGTDTGPLAKSEAYKAAQVMEAYKKAHPRTVSNLQTQSGVTGADAEIMKRHLRSQSRHTAHALPGMMTALAGTPHA